ncbi:MAG: alanine--tRNA ligase-related protein, partial [Pseudomonadota bacterium]
CSIFDSCLVPPLASDSATLLWFPGPADTRPPRLPAALSLATLGRGLALLETATADLSVGATLSGETAFKLYDTYGFPLDLTADILRARDIRIDQGGFDAAMAAQKAASKAAGFHSGDASQDKLWFDLADTVGETVFLGYEDTVGEAKVMAIVKDGELAEAVAPGEQGEIVLDRTPFYAESGGQAGDHGDLETADGAKIYVTDTQKRAGTLHSHIGKSVSHRLQVGDVVSAKVSKGRRIQVMANHSATHLLHAALRRILGPHVAQKGSLVEADRLRFDFAHDQSVSDVQLEMIEDEVNAVIRQNHPVGVQRTTPEAAIEAGALALFGEKYGDEVRVLSMGDNLDAAGSPYSVELCGGTHVERTGDIAMFAITSEGGVSAGVRRIEAATGAEAFEFLRGRARLATDIASQLKVPLKDIAARVTNLADERRQLERGLAEAKKALALSSGGGGQGPETINGIALIARIAQGVGGKDLRALIDEAKAQMKSGVAAFIGVNGGKASVAIGVTADLTETVSAVDLVRPAAVALGGKGGGGRPDMAQAGGPDGDKAEEALDAVRLVLKEL